MEDFEEFILEFVKAAPKMTVEAQNVVARYIEYKSTPQINKDLLKAKP